MAKIKVITLKVKEKFSDKYIDGLKHNVGEIMVLDDIDRAEDICKRGLGELLNIEGDYKGKGDKVVVYTSRIFKIGGIETACENIARTFSDRNIEFVFGEADIEQALRVAQYRPVKIDAGEPIICDVLIVMGYDGIKRLNAKKIQCRKIYHQVHADWGVLKKVGLYKDYKLDTTGVDRFLSVSETAQKGLKSAFNVDSVIVPNILCKPELGEFRIFLSLTRLEKEKGGEILLKMVKRLEKANKSFLWIICGGGSECGKIRTQLNAYKNVVFLDSDIKNKWTLNKVDYLVSTSLTESYGYSIREALSVGTPVISTDIPEARKVIKDGVNGYLISADLSDFDGKINDIFAKKPVFKDYAEEVDGVWERVLRGEL